MANHPNAQDWDSHVTTRGRHDSFGNQPGSGHLLQTSTWADLKRHFGWWATRVTAHRRGRVVAGAQILFRPLPLGLGSIAYVPKGPLVDWDDLDQCRYVLSLCDEAARAGRAISLKIEPDLPDTPETVDIMRRLELHPSQDIIQPRRTMIVDLSAPEEEIMARMKQKTRYNIRLAEKKGVTVRAATPETALADLKTFNCLMRTTGERFRFGVHTDDYYCHAYDLFSHKDQVKLFLAEYREMPLAAIMVFALDKRAWYLYGASSDLERQRMPTYATQWAAMRWARARGCQTYDLWGVPDATRDELESQFTERHDGLWPVYRFKRGFGGQIVRSVGVWEHVYIDWAHKLYLRYVSRRRS